jgi:hypothetical protein
MIIGKRKDCEKSTEPSLMYLFCIGSACSRRQSCEKNWCRCLRSTFDKGVIFKPNNNGIVCLSGADFSWKLADDDAERNNTKIKSLSGYIAKDGGCAPIWFSKMKSKTSLLATKVYYVVLSQSLRECFSNNVSYE